MDIFLLRRLPVDFEPVGIHTPLSLIGELKGLAHELVQAIFPNGVDTSTSPMENDDLGQKMIEIFDKYIVISEAAVEAKNMTPTQETKAKKRNGPVYPYMYK